MNHNVTQRLLKSLFLIFLAAVTGLAQDHSRALLNHLQGQWLMTGIVLKEPVQYTAEGTWVLQNQFFRLHMTDAASPPQYEANLYIGIDSTKQEYVAHWLDSFGGTGARVVGFGSFSADTIEIIYPYAEGRFRNAFKYDPLAKEWSLVIETEQPNGSWVVFAQYIIAKR